MRSLEADRRLAEPHPPAEPERAAEPHRLAERRRRVPLAIPIVVAVAWAVSLAAQATGGSTALDHHELFETGLRSWGSLMVFLLAWQVMIASMMLPSSLPMVRHYWVAASRQERAGHAMAAFLGGYAAVWSGFGVVALASDAGLHRLVHSWAWLGARPHLIAGGVLALAGAFQFTPLKDRCLRECRHPGAFLVQHYRRGAAAGFRLGVRHGLFCLGCCWALMLLVFAVGVSSIVWMAALAAVMVYEKVGRRGRELTPVVGGVLLAWGGLLLAVPSWLPLGLRVG